VAYGTIADAGQRRAAFDEVFGEGRGVGPGDGGDRRAVAERERNRASGKDAAKHVSGEAGSATGQRRNLAAGWATLT
jgi:hypothetical protein